MAAKKRKVNTKKKQNKKVVEENLYDEKLLLEIKVIGSFTVAVLLTLGILSFGGILGELISRLFFGLFGIISYIVPIAIFIGVWFIKANNGSRKAIVKLISVYTLMIVFGAAFHLITLGYTGKSAGQIFTICGKERTGGGIIGGGMGEVLSSAFSIYGAFFILIAIAIIALIMITEKSFLTPVKKTGTRVYNKSLDGYQRIKEDGEEYRRERRYRKNMRLHNKAVGIGDTKVYDAGYEEAGIHELYDVGNKSVYRGHVDIEDNIEDNVHINQVNEPPEMEEPREVYIKSQVQEEEKLPSNVDSQNDADEQEPFVPKERIVVSDSAKEVMRRKPFSNESVSTNSESIPETPTASKDNNKPKNKMIKYTFPPISLLKKGTVRKNQGTRRGGLSETAMKLQQILENFGVNATITNESHGPSVTRYELQPEMGTKVSKITSLTDDIKLNLAASDIRIEAPIPGKAAVGIEVPNTTRESVLLRDLIESDELKNHPSKIAFAAGMDIAGNVIVADIAKMPHMLIAGTTGSGKSVFTNSIIMSILYRANPDEVKLIIVDPKVVEFGVYNGIPHLLIPVVTEPKKAAGALAWAVAEMSKRYQKFADLNVRDLKGYNDKIQTIEVEEGEERPEKLPQIVIIIDELADLMMVAAKEVEESICRLAQLARAAGIHLIIATQRPSVDVVTGLIKANIPSRVALLVSSGTDSRTIIDMNGAEKLLGNGDMLFNPSGYIKPVRLQGAFVSDKEVTDVVEFIKSHTEAVEYDENITKQMTMPIESSSGQGALANKPDDGRDEYFAESGRFVIEKDKASTSMLQRMFKIGFNRAARIMDQLCEAGVVGEEEGTKPRKVLMTMSEFEEFLEKEQNNGGNST